MVIYAGQEADFYILSHGNNAGRPMHKPCPNCFAVWSNKEHAFEIVYSLFHAKKFFVVLRGSVIPFLSLRECRKLLECEFSKTYDPKLLEAVKSANSVLDIKRKELGLYKSLVQSLALRAIR